MYKFSIIIPVYNAEKYLCQCLESIYNQDYKDFEVIIIDDGSIDSSGRICDEFIKKTDEGNFQLIHINNSGVSNARNIGLRMASGKYVCFIDADDYVDENYLSIYDQYLGNEDIDILYGGIRWISLGKESLPYFDTHGEKYKGIDVIDMFPNTYEHKAIPFSWRYCFRKDFLLENKLFFPDDVKYGEDAIFNMNAIILSKSFVSVSQVVYNYRTDNNDSLGRKEVYKNNMLQDLEKNYLSRKRIIPLLINSKEEYTLDMTKKNLFEWLPIIIENYKDTAKGFTIKDSHKILSTRMFKESADFVLSNNLSKTKIQKLYFMLIKNRFFIPLYFIWKNIDLELFII